MKVNTEKLEKLAKSLASDVGGRCLDSSVMIGEVSGVYFRLTAMVESEAAESGDDEVLDHFRCIDA